MDKKESPSKDWLAADENIRTACRKRGIAPSKYKATMDFRPKIYAGKYY